MRHAQHPTVMNTAGVGNLLQNRLIIVVVVNQHLKPLGSVVTAFIDWDE